MSYIEQIIKYKRWAGPINFNLTGPFHYLLSSGVAKKGVRKLNFQKTYNKSIEVVYHASLILVNLFFTRKTLYGKRICEDFEFKMEKD